jgi:hypothetical protein
VAGSGTGVVCVNVWSTPEIEEKSPTPEAKTCMSLEMSSSATPEKKVESAPGGVRMCSRGVPGAPARPNPQRVAARCGPAARSR